ncbi:helix-hairpin-helix domain-containing protein [Lactobacillus rizhaonensis]|uniref:helix-hairpin-helix domain-containing protein n=1 Tax=Lactobacillus rizhaonensis TaxID=3082863 RepID=UPI0030C7591A
MNWGKIKAFIEEHKQYLFIGMVLLVIVLLVWSKRPNSNDNFDEFDYENENTVQNENKAGSNPSKKLSNTEAVTKKVAATKPKDVTCDISGAISHQGVYTLKSGARLNDLIAAAGGIKNNAQLKNVNRALILKDQDKIHIPYKGEKLKAEQVVESVSSNGSTSAPETTSDQTNVSNKVNINTANVSQLQQLNGIGEKKAQQIIAYRQKSGEFKSLEDLMQVSGIGEKTFAALKDQLEI